MGANNPDQQSVDVEVERKSLNAEKEKMSPARAHDVVESWLEPTMMTQFVRGLRGAAESNVERQKEFGERTDHVLVVLRVTRTNIKEQCLLVGRTKNEFVKHVPWTLKNPPNTKERI